jgi:hypothetical protein
LSEVSIMPIVENCKLKFINYRNSLIIFILNAKELKEKYWKGMILCLESY